MKRRLPIFLLAVIMPAVMVNCKNSVKIKTLPYPETRMDLGVVEDYHGTQVADPYRWLEDDNSTETAQWVTAQNIVTFDYLSQIPYREQVKQRLTELWDYPKVGVPSVIGDYLFFFKNDGLQNQSVLYRQKGLQGEPVVFIDPNTLSTDGTVALGSISFSKDNKYMAYTVSAAGSDWTEIKLMEVETAQQMPDVIDWVKFSNASWAADSKGFYYSAYDKPEGANALSGINKFQKIYYHTLGEKQSDDKLIFEDKSHPLRYFDAFESRDGKYQFLNTRDGTHGNSLAFRETARPNAAFKTLFEGFDSEYDIVDCYADMAYVYTNSGAPNYRLVVVDMKATEPAMKEVIAQKEHLLSGVRSVGGYFMAFYLENAQSSVYQYDRLGELVRKVTLPGIGSVGGFGGREEFAETYYAVSSYIAPATIYKYTFADGKSELYEQPKLNFDPSLYVTQQVFYTSKDGTRVSMFITHKKGLEKNGENPTYLYAYGGFNSSMTPGFNPSAIMFMEQGGVYAIANLRGGGEYGEEWHKAGMLGSKQNVFDDFISAAEYLIADGYTSKNKLAIAGGSNGGLLVGACMTQRPDLFAVALPAVGVMDMLRYHLFTVGWGWAVEYGSSDKPDQFEYIYKYSPLHNIEEGTCYPATLVTTADHDDRVVPAHSFKFAATLQAAQSCDNPALIRIDVSAGHGAGKPTSKRIEEAADTYSFMLWNTNAKVNFDK